MYIGAGVAGVKPSGRVNTEQKFQTMWSSCISHARQLKKLKKLTFSVVT